MMNRISLVRLFMCLLVLSAAFTARPILAQETLESTPETTPATVNLLEDLIDAAFTSGDLNPLTGEPVALTLTVAMPPDAQLTDWPDFPEAWLPFVVSHEGEIQVENRVAGGLVYRQTLTVYLWIPGEYATPETLIGYQLAEVEDVYYVPVRPLLFRVPSSLESRDLNELVRKPIRPPIKFFYLPTWIVVVLVVMLVGGVWLWLHWLENRRLVLAARVTDTLVAPREFALTELARLRADELSGEGVYIGVSATLRAYIQRRFDVAAPDMTTAELVEALRGVPENQLGQYLNALNRLLQQTDFVKFANQHPSRTSIPRLIDLARHWVISVDQPPGFLPEDLPDEVDLA